MKYTIIGIDPGASGGIAIYDNGNIEAFKIPKASIDLNDKFAYIKENFENPLVFLEKVSHFSGGADDAVGKKFAIAKMMDGYTKLKTLLETNRLPYCEVHPATWQTALIKRIKGESKQIRKNRYKALAQENYPEIKVTLAISDALCIMSFGRIKVLNDWYWIEGRLIGKIQT